MSEFLTDLPLPATKCYQLVHLTLGRAPFSSLDVETMTENIRTINISFYLSERCNRIMTLLDLHRFLQASLFHLMQLFSLTLPCGFQLVWTSKDSQITCHIFTYGSFSDYQRCLIIMGTFRVNHTIHSKVFYTLIATLLALSCSIKCTIFIETIGFSNSLREL